MSANAVPFTAALALVCLLVACGEYRADQPGDALPEALRAGYTREPPYSFQDDEGRVTGESPETLLALAQELGIDSIRWVALEFEQLIPHLRDGRIDVIAAGMFITPARSEEVRFSRPTSCSGAALVRRRGDRRPLASITEVVAMDSVTIAVISGGVEEQALRLLGVGDERILAVPDVRTGAVAVQSGVAAVLAVTAPTAREAVEADTMGVLVASEPYDPPAGTELLLGGCSALAFRQGDDTLADAVDCALDEFVGSAGHIAMLESFGLGAANVPGEADALPKVSRGSSCPIQ